MGMVPMCAPGARKRIVSVLSRLSLPTRIPVSADDILEAMGHDKKRQGDKITVVYVPEIGRFEFREMEFSDFAEHMKGRWDNEKHLRKRPLRHNIRRKPRKSIGAVIDRLPSGLEVNLDYINESCFSAVLPAQSPPQEKSPTRVL